MAEASLIYQDSVSNKFWNIETNKKKYTATWGRIGTFGQSQTKSFYSEAACEKAAKNRIKSKTRKGYTEGITEELITETFITILSGIAEYRNPGEIYYRTDLFGKTATLEFVDGDSDHIIFRHYYWDDTKKSEHEWKDKKQHGKNSGWNEDGTKCWVKTFKAGKLIKEKRY